MNMKDYSMTPQAIWNRRHPKTMKAINRRQYSRYKKMITEFKEEHEGEKE